MSTTNLYVVNGLPTYGKWGGPGWSAGELVPAGAHLTDAQKAVDGKDDLDRLFKAHDIAYDEAAKMTDPVAEAKAISDADMQLVVGMWLSGQLSDPLAEVHRIAAMDVFDKKLVLDVLGVAFNNVDNFLTGIQKLFHQAEITRSPLVLDLNGDGVSTVAISAGVHFDQNNNRFAELSGWVAPSDGLLVRDLNGNGQIDGGSELFGDNTLLANGQKAANGFISLAELDANMDDTVDATEAVAAGIKIWKDANQNGITDAGELFALNQAGVSSIATGYSAASSVDAQGNRHSQAGHYTAADGTIRAMDDVWFAVDTARTIEKDTVVVSAQIAALPDLAGFGNVHSLHQAMALDTTGHLQSLVEQFMAATDTASRKAITTQLIYAWAGVENVDPASRAASMIYGNVIGDARKLASLEALLGGRGIEMAANDRMWQVAA
ncbi:MAG: hypothetical protein Q7U78_07125 [Gallionella sp.]|nr:hypothetical protein [Gallionella sp.]